MGQLIDSCWPKATLIVKDGYLAPTPRWEVDGWCIEIVSDFRIRYWNYSLFKIDIQTLFMLVSALMGLELMKQAYAHAIESDYRFYSYGDGSLLLPRK